MNQATTPQQSVPSPYQGKYDFYLIQAALLSSPHSMKDHEKRAEDGIQWPRVGVKPDAAWAIRAD